MEGVRLYTPPELGGRDGAIEWLTLNLGTSRQIRRPQLLILGRPQSGKTRLVFTVREFLHTHSVPPRKNDFTKATTNVGLWVIDEFKSLRMSPEVLNMVLDGQEVGLDSKYGHIFHKCKNVPIMLITNDYPHFQSETDQCAFDTRIVSCEFIKDKKLGAGRLAKTILSVLESRNIERLESTLGALDS